MLEKEIEESYESAIDLLLTFLTLEHRAHLSRKHIQGEGTVDIGVCMESKRGKLKIKTFLCEVMAS